MFKILFIGDIVGRSGRRVLVDNLSDLQRIHGIDYTIVNAENAAAVLLDFTARRAARKSPWTGISTGG